MSEKKQNWYTNPRKYHFIYKTTCQVNGKYYYGMHSTDDLNDGYIGSGTMLWHSIKKYGRENFKLDILEFCTDRETLKQREVQLITEEILSDPMCMNLTLGGHGGWFTHNKDQSNRVHRQKGAINANSSEKKTKNLEYRRKLSERNRKMHAEGKLKRPDWTGKHHTDEAKKKISIASSLNQKGTGNSQYGTCWIYSIEEKRSLKIKSEELNHYLSIGWTKGRKMYKTGV